MTTLTLSSRPRRIWLGLVAFCGMLTLAAVRSPAGTIIDGAHIFSSTAVAQAQQAIDQIRIRHQKDLNVETIASVPPDQQGALEAQGKNAFFEQWARERAKAMGTNGVYLLVCMEPRHLQVEVGNRTETREFTAADRDALRTQLISQFKARQYDAGLTDAANFVLERMDANTSQSTVPANQGTGIVQNTPIYGGGGGGTPFGGWICMGVVVLFIVVMFLRRGSGAGGYGPNYPMNPGGQMGWGSGGGGGFGRGLLGGLLGGALGSWGYDRFSRGGGVGDSSSFGPDTTGGGGGFSASSGTDTSFSGSGGDFGGGGGDSGGGGGDSGGGGGGDF